MSRLLTAALLILCFALMGLAAAGPADHEAKVRYIGAGAEYQTPYYVFHTDQPGPIVLFEAGLHGDEIAGIYALDELMGELRVKSGRLIVLPRMNMPACLKEVRLVNKDLNQVFPGRRDGEIYEWPLAREIFEMLGREKVEYVVTGHESRYLYNPVRKRGLAQTIIHVTQTPPAYAEKWVQSINRRTAQEETFSLLYYFPRATGSTDNFVHTYSLQGGFCVETWRGFDLGRRIEMHKIVLVEFLKTINMAFEMIAP
ncbi:MAG: succinylglutamate desuccinylase/aspartoacylase family protein [Thermodesulfobacteriota bacterium]